MLGLVLLTVGFLLQDRLALDGPRRRASGAVSFACGLVLVAVQGVLVPRLGWAPTRLLRTGAPIAAAGAALLTVASGFWVIGAGMLLLALGLGVALPGYTVGPTLLVAPSQQGSVAGLVTATTGLTFVVGPAAGAALYQIIPSSRSWQLPCSRSSAGSSPPLIQRSSDPPSTRLGYTRMIITIDC